MPENSSYSSQHLSPRIAEPKVPQRSRWSSISPFRFESKYSLEEVTQALVKLNQDEGNKISLHRSEEGYHFHYRLQRLSNRGEYYATASGEGRIWQKNSGYVVVQGIARIGSMHHYGKIGFVIALLTLSLFAFTEDLLVLFPLLPLATGTILFLNSYREREIVIENIAEALGQPIETPARRHALEKKLAQDAKHLEEQQRLESAQRALAKKNIRPERAARIERRMQKEQLAQARRTEKEKRTQKTKRDANTETLRAAPLSEDEIIRADSIWNDAISEYERPEQDS